MPVRSIQYIKPGTSPRNAIADKSGLYRCHPFGSNVDPVYFTTLDDAASYLRTHRRAGIRVEPDSKVVKHIYIDGIPR